MIKKYFPSKTKIKLPDMPGRIIAQMAMAPQRKMNHRSFEVSAGVVMVIAYAATAPAANAITVFAFH